LKKQNSQKQNFQERSESRGSKGKWKRKNEGKRDRKIKKRREEKKKREELMRGMKVEGVWV